MELFSEAFIMLGMVNPGIDYGARIGTDREKELFIGLGVKGAWTVLVRVCQRNKTNRRQMCG